MTQLLFRATLGTLALTGATVAVTLLSRPSFAQVQVVPAFVRLQAQTPGTVQTGHSNVSGTATAGQFVGGGAGLTGVNADLIDGLNSTAFLQSIPVPLTLTGSSATHIIRGENSLNGGSGITGVSTSATGTTNGGRFETSSSSGLAVFGIAHSGTGTTYGGRFEVQSTNGRGVFGSVSATTGLNYGGWFGTNSSGGRGVYATATATTGGVYGVQAEISSTSNPSAAVFGTSLGTTGTTYGVLGVSNSSTGTAVFGSAESLTGSANGGFFASNAASGKGVVGRGFHSTGVNYGGYFESDSTNGYGAYGKGRQAGLFGESQTKYGVLGTGVLAGGFFTTTDNDGRGVIAALTSTTGTAIGVEATFVSPSGRGVQGDSDATTGTPYAVFGDTDGSGYALYASGNTGASGTKSFRIDHPLDRENKYLLHYSTESPVPQNFYVGNVVTGAQGYAWVQLPDYFAEINEDFKYQLTVVDGSDDFVLVKVVREIEGNRFQIRTSKPNVKVSWRVDANRNDAYVRRYRPVQEVDKPDGERGFFEHPEIFGLGKERSLEHDRPGAKNKRLNGMKANPPQ